MKFNNIYDIGDIKYKAEMEERAVYPFSQLNWLTGGAKLNRLVIITAKTDEGKSTLASMFLCEFIKQGFICFADFGEDEGDEACERIYKQYTAYEKDNYIAKQYIQNGKATNIFEYKLSEKKFNDARDFFKNKLYLFDIMKSANIENLLSALDEARSVGCQIGLIDNLENVEYEGENENKQFKDISIALRNYAKKYNMLIILVAHTKKTDREVLIPNTDDIKGSSAVANTAKEIICIVRTDKMDKESKQYKSLKRIVAQNNYDIDEADGIIFVQKTKGRKIGMFTVKYNLYTNTYYECKKINESEKDSDKVVIYDTKQESTKQRSVFKDAKLIDGELPF